MEIKLNSLTVTDYDFSDTKKVRFVHEMTYDKAIREYVSWNIDKIIMRPHYTNGIENSCGYIVKSHDNLVGFFRPFVFFDTDIGLDYAIHPNFRGQGYGTRLLVEVSDYFFERNIKRVALRINNSNTSSIIAAKKAGFEEEYVGLQEVTEYVKKRK